MDETFLLTGRECAAHLRIGHSKFAEMKRNEEFGPPEIKLSRKFIRYRRSDLVRWIAAGCPTRKQFVEAK